MRTFLIILGGGIVTIVAGVGLYNLILLLIKGTIR